MEISKLSAAESTQNVSALSGVQGDNSNSQPIDFGGRPKTKAYLEAEKRIKTAKNKLDYMIAEYNNPSTSASRKSELKAKIDKFKNIYANSSYTIADNGKITFKFTGSMNVEDFKEAYNIKEGKMRSYLDKRHQKAVENGDVYANKLIRNFDGETDVWTLDDCNSEELEFRYTTSNTGSQLIYTDGYAKYVSRGAFSYNWQAPDYTRMKLDQNDCFSIGYGCLEE